jgi:hypothetical protein
MYMHLADIGEELNKTPGFEPVENVDGHPWSCPASLKPLVAAMMALDPKDRPGCLQILETITGG